VKRLRDGKPVAGKLYSLEIDENDSDQLANYLGSMQLQQGSLLSRLAATFADVDLDQATSLAFARDQTAAYVLTYKHVVRFAKSANQTWSDALLSKGDIIHTHGLRQAEAMTIDKDGVLWLTSEKLPAPIVAVPTQARFE